MNAVQMDMFESHEEKITAEEARKIKNMVRGAYGRINELEKQVSSLLELVKEEKNYTFRLQ